MQFSKLFILTAVYLATATVASRLDLRLSARASDVACTVCCIFTSSLSAFTHLDIESPTSVTPTYVAISVLHLEKLNLSEIALLRCPIVLRSPLLAQMARFWAKRDCAFVALLVSRFWPQEILAHHQSGLGVHHLTLGARMDTSVITQLYVFAYSFSAY